MGIAAIEEWRALLDVYAGPTMTMQQVRYMFDALAHEVEWRQTTIDAQADKVKIADLLEEMATKQMIGVERACYANVEWQAFGYVWMEDHDGYGGGKTLLAALEALKKEMGAR
jgi:hypothetical protein